MIVSGIPTLRTLWEYHPARARRSWTYDGHISGLIVGGKKTPNMRGVTIKHIVK
jgi:hypothetical protein